MLSSFLHEFINKKIGWLSRSLMRNDGCMSLKAVQTDNRQGPNRVSLPGLL